jgi:hypothetical protein
MSLPKLRQTAALVALPSSAAITHSPCAKAFSLCPLMLQKWAVR